MFQVQYRCAYRDWWYEDLEFLDPSQAVNRAMQIYTARHTPVRITLSNQIVWHFVPPG